MGSVFPRSGHFQKGAGLACALGLVLFLHGVYAKGADRPSQSPLAISSGTGVSGHILDRADPKLGISSAIVTLTAPGFEEKVSTGVNGQFAFLDIPSGKAYRLSASRVGYVSDVWTGASDRGLTREMTVQAKQWISDLQISLWRAAAIGGEIRNELQEPAVGALVQIMSTVTVGGASQWAQGLTTYTDDLGRYSFGRLPPGSYLIAARSGIHTRPLDAPSLSTDFPQRDRSESITELPTRGFLRPTSEVVPFEKMYLNTYYPGVTRLEEGRSVILEAGQRALQVDFAIAPTKAAPVHGVVWSDQASAAGVPLRILPLDSADLGSGMEIAATMTDDQGRFFFPAVPLGRYRLEAAAWLSTTRVFQTVGEVLSFPPATPGFRNDQITFLDSGPGGRDGVALSRSSSRLWGAVTIDVESVQKEPVLLAVKAGINLSGRLNVEESGQAHGSDFAHITLVPLSGGWTQPVRALVRLGNRGEFELAGLRAGSYLVEATLASPTPAAVRRVLVRGIDVGSNPIELANDESEVEIVVTTQLGTILGRVAVNPGSELPRPGVIYCPAEPRYWQLGSVGQRPRFGMAPVDSMGNYKLEHLPAGDYYLLASRDTSVYSWATSDLSRWRQMLPRAVSLSWGDARVVNLSFSDK